MLIFKPTPPPSVIVVRFGKWLTIMNDPLVHAVLQSINFIFFFFRHQFNTEDVVNYFVNIPTDMEWWFCQCINNEFIKRDHQFYGCGHGYSLSGIGDWSTCVCVLLLAYSRRGEPHPLLLWHTDKHRQRHHLDPEEHENTDKLYTLRNCNIWCVNYVGLRALCCSFLHFERSRPNPGEVYIWLDVVPSVPQ